VLYDPKCELCSRLKGWLLVQRSWLGLSMIPAGSEKAERMFPGVKDLAGCNDLVVISDEGDVYLNNSAWIMALYALEDYRDWACRLAHPLVMPFARQAFEIVSRNRYAISRWLGPEAMASDLSKVRLSACDLPAARIADYLE
jgi:predicted DCC family thiol-disulfide oxidoreductase YuxK